MLSYYVQHLGFRTVEINYTYYRIPSAKTMESMVRRSDEHFDFTVKCSREMTHDIIRHDQTLADNPGAFTQFLEGVRPLVEAGRLGCLLAQFPYSFPKTRPNIEYLLRCRERVGDIPFVVEFRHKSWVSPQTFPSLRRHDIGFCVVDEPPLAQLMPFVPEVTSDIAYMRLHGRNPQWFTALRDERYNYSYTKAELAYFVDAVQHMEKQAKRVYVFFNNCHHGQAALNAKDMLAMIDEVAPGVLL